jgi:hypothetical protein
MMKTIFCILLVASVGCSSGPSAAPESQPDSVGGEAPASSEAQHEALRVAAPRRDALVTSPLVVTGEARGSWYFEATFPVSLLDAQGNTLANSYAQAQGEWMIEGFVPFRAELTFTLPPDATDATGTLVLQKANPSGLPEHAAETRVPVQLPVLQPQ